MVESVRKLKKNGKPRIIHPNSLKNLRPNPNWKPGVVANPLGQSLKQCLERMMDKPLPSSPPPPDAPARDHLVYATVKAAIEGKSIPFLEVWNRLAGKVSQPLSGDGGGPIRINYVLTPEKGEGKDVS